MIDLWIIMMYLSEKNGDTIERYRVSKCDHVRASLQKRSSRGTP